MTRACSLSDTFCAARTKAIGLVAVSVGLAVTGCAGSDDDAAAAGGCGRSVEVQQAGAPVPGDLTVGADGGYGGFYCFASTP